MLWLANGEVETKGSWFIIFYLKNQTMVNLFKYEQSLKKKLNIARWRARRGCICWVLSLSVSLILKLSLISLSNAPLQEPYDMFLKLNSTWKHGQETFEIFGWLQGSKYLDRLKEFGNSWWHEDGIRFLWLFVRIFGWNEISVSLFTGILFKHRSPQEPSTSSNWEILCNE